MVALAARIAKGILERGQSRSLKGAEGFNQLCLQRFRVGKIDDANGHTINLGHLRRAVAPCSGNNLEAALIQGRVAPQHAETDIPLGAWGICS